MKKSILLILVVLILLSAVPLSASAAEILVTIDGNYMNYEQGYPVMIEGRTLVPLRAIFEGLGATVVWDPVYKSIKATKGERKVTLVLDESLALVYTSKDVGSYVDLDAPATLIEGRTYVPLRFVSEAMGAAVDYQGGSFPSITINSPKTPVQQLTKPPVSTPSQPITPVEEEPNPISSEDRGQITIYNGDDRNINNMYLTVEVNYELHTYKLVKHIIPGSFKNTSVTVEIELDSQDKPILNVKKNTYNGVGVFFFVNPGYDMRNAVINLDFQVSSWHRVDKAVNLTNDYIFKLDAHNGKKVDGLWTGDFLKASY